MSRPQWFVADMDDGLLRAETTRVEAVDWAKRFSNTDRVRGRYCYGNHSYEYILGTTDLDEGSNFFIGRADHATNHGWDLDQPPLYPFLSKPWQLWEPALDVVATIMDYAETERIVIEWTAAATKHNLTVQDSRLRNNNTYSPTEVKVRGRWYELVCLPCLNSDLFDITAKRNT